MDGAATTERLVDAKAVAEHLGVTHWWVYKAANAGTIPSLRVGRVFRFRLSAVVAALEAAQPAAAAG